MKSKRDYRKRERTKRSNYSKKRKGRKQREYRSLKIYFRRVLKSKKQLYINTNSESPPTEVGGFFCYSPKSRLNVKLI